MARIGMVRVGPVVVLALILFSSCRQDVQPARDGATRTGDTAPKVLGTAADSREVEQLSEASLSPFKRQDGRKFRVAVVGSGEWYTYYNQFSALLGGLTTIGWMNDVSGILERNTELGAVIKELQAFNYSDYVEFPPELFVQLNWDDANLVDPTWKRITAGDRNDIDFIISFGTYATKLLSDLPGFQVPVLGEEISDPINSDIITSYDDSGKDFLSVRGDPLATERQVRMFYDVVKFKKLGLIYADTVTGRSYAGIESIKKIAQEKGFEIVSYTDGIPEDDKDLETAMVNYVKGIHALGDKVDAFYFGTTWGFEFENTMNIIPAVNLYRKPTFAQEGSRFVKRGVLMGESASEVKSIGIFNAKNMVAVFHGKKARDLKQVFEHVPQIALNLKEAELIGYDVPIDIIASADEIYQTIDWGDTDAE